MLIHDAAPAIQREITPEGFLKVRARIARAGLHDYRAGELGAPAGFAPDATLRVYRPPDAVFERDSMNSFAGKPVTDGHPPAMIDAGNWRRYAIGHSGSKVSRDGDHLTADLLITDADAVRRAQAGAELSNGYHADFDFTPGATPDGDPYDAVQSNIRGNHIALVEAGRCGDSCRIDDAAAHDCGCGSRLVTVAIGGDSIETTPAGADVLQRLRKNLEAKDGAIMALTASLGEESTLEERVRKRTAALDGARLVFGSHYEARDRSTADVRRAVAEHLLGTDLENRSEAYVEAAFDTLLAGRTAPNPLAAQLATTQASGRDTARLNRDRFLNHAWKGDHGVR